MASDTMRAHLVSVSQDLRAMIPCPATEKVQRVLRYLETMERSADLRNDRKSAFHFQQCWVTVCDAYYGAPDVAPERRVHIPLADGVRRLATRPRWFTEKYSRPLQKVIARVTERLPGGVGRSVAFQSYDVLACGHRLPARELLPDEKPAKHRRCKECGRG